MTKLNCKKKRSDSDDGEECIKIFVHKPTDRDILCGRGKGTIKHPGNVLFFAVIRDRLHEYVSAPKRIEKSAIVSSIVSSLKEDGLRFLKRDNDTDKYYIISNDQAKVKTGHAIRDLIRNDPLKKDGGVRPNTIPDIAASTTGPAGICSIINDKKKKEKEKGGTGTNNRIKQPKRSLATSKSASSQRAFASSSTGEVPRGNCTVQASSPPQPSRIVSTSSSTSSSSTYFDDDKCIQKSRQMPSSFTLAPSTGPADLPAGGWGATMHTSMLPTTHLYGSTFENFSTTGPYSCSTFDNEERSIKYEKVEGQSIPPVRYHSYMEPSPRNTRDDIITRIGTDLAGNEDYSPRNEGGGGVSLLAPSSLPRSSTVSPPAPSFPQEFSKWDFSIDNPTTISSAELLEAEVKEQEGMWNQGKGEACCNNMWDGEKLLLPVTPTPSLSPGRMMTNKELLQRAPTPYFPLSFATWDFSTDDDDALIDSLEDQQRKQQVATTVVCS